MNVSRQSLILALTIASAQYAVDAGQARETSVRLAEQFEEQEKEALRIIDALDNEELITFGN